MPEIIEEYNQHLSKVIERLERIVLGLADRHIKTLLKNQEQDHLGIQKLQEEVKRLQLEVRYLVGIMD